LGDGKAINYASLAAAKGEDTRYVQTEKKMGSLFSMLEPTSAAGESCHQA